MNEINWNTEEKNCYVEQDFISSTMDKWDDNDEFLEKICTEIFDSI